MDNDKPQHVSITNSQVQVVPSATGANMTISGIRPTPTSPDSPLPAVNSQLSCQLSVTHDAVGVPAMMLQARRHIVLHAAYYPKYGMDQQGKVLWKAMKDNPKLHLTAIFTDIRNAAWAEEFARILRPFYTAEDFQTDLDFSKRHFIRCLKEFGPKRVSIIDASRLPLFPVIMIDNTLIVGHYTHSEEIAPDGLWFTIHHPKISLMYESLLAGNSPLYETPEEIALIRYLDELIVETGESKPAPKAEPLPQSEPEFQPTKKESTQANISVVRNQILAYVSRVSPLLSYKWDNRFMELWEDILDLPEVKLKIYMVGRQRGTTFNRNLVANILNRLSIYGVYRGGYRTTEIAICLEGDISHPVRAALGQVPPSDIIYSIDELMKSK